MTGTISQATALPEGRTSARTAIARRLRKHHGTDLESELIIVCPECGDRFSIVGEVPCLDSVLAERRGAWLLDQFVWDHIQESKHRGSIPLPRPEDLQRRQVR